jgi:hypothetical protein
LGAQITDASVDILAQFTGASWLTSTAAASQRRFAELQRLAHLVVLDLRYTSV